MAQEANGQTGSGGKGNKTLVILLGVVIVLLLASVTVFGALLIKSNKTNSELQSQTEEKQEKRSVVVTEENVEEVQDEFFNQEYIPPGYFSATMNNVWHFQDGESNSDDAYVANDTANSNDIYFDLFLAENEEDAIYQSPVIPLGEELKNFKLDKSLDAGTYDCVMIYHLVDEEQNTVDTVRVAVTVIVAE
jgi:hypothetical protein